MTERSEAVLMRRVYDALERGEPDRLRGLFAKDALWHVPGRHPLAGEYRGWAEIADYVIGLAGATDTLKIDNWDVVGGEDVFPGHRHAVALGRLCARCGEAELDTLTCDVVSIRGQITEVWSFVLNQEAADRFWSSAVRRGFPEAVVGAYYLG